MISRRQFVAASLAVPAVWVAPQILSVPRANAAQLNSRPSTPPKSPMGNVDNTTPMGPPLATDLPAVLPFTGQEQRREVEVGVAALTTGGVLWALNRPEKRAMQ